MSISMADAGRFLESRRHTLLTFKCYACDVARRSPLKGLFTVSCSHAACVLHACSQKEQCLFLLRRTFARRENASHK